MSNILIHSCGLSWKPKVINDCKLERRFKHAYHLTFQVNDFYLWGTYLSYCVQYIIGTIQLSECIVMS